MEFIFKDEAFKFETLRAAGFAADAGADIGEVIVTTVRFPKVTRTRGRRRGRLPLNTQPGAAELARCRRLGERPRGVLPRLELLPLRRSSTAAKILNDPQVLNCRGYPRTTSSRLPNCSTDRSQRCRSPSKAARCQAISSSSMTAAPPAQQSSTPTALTPPARRATSSSVPQHYGADTTSSPTTGRDRAG